MCFEIFAISEWVFSLVVIKVGWGWKWGGDGRWWWWWLDKFCNSLSLIIMRLCIWQVIMKFEPSSWCYISKWFVRLCLKNWVSVCELLMDLSSSTSFHSSSSSSWVSSIIIIVLESIIWYTEGRIEQYFFSFSSLPIQIWFSSNQHSADQVYHHLYPHHLTFNLKCYQKKLQETDTNPNLSIVMIHSQWEWRWKFHLSFWIEWEFQSVKSFLRRIPILSLLFHH